VHARAEQIDDRRIRRPHRYRHPPGAGIGADGFGQPNVGDDLAAPGLTGQHPTQDQRGVAHCPIRNLLGPDDLHILGRDGGPDREVPGQRHHRVAAGRRRRGNRDRSGGHDQGDRQHATQRAG